MKQIPNYDYGKYTNEAGGLIREWQKGNAPKDRWTLRKAIRRAVFAAYNDGYVNGSKDAGKQAIDDIKRKIKEFLKS